MKSQKSASNVPVSNAPVSQAVPSVILFAKRTNLKGEVNRRVLAVHPSEAKRIKSELQAKHYQVKECS